MTLVLNLHLDIVKMYVCAKNEVPTFSGSKVIAWKDTQTATQTDTQTDGLNWNYYLSIYTDGNKYLTVHYFRIHLWASAFIVFDAYTGGD